MLEGFKAGYLVVLNAALINWSLTGDILAIVLTLLTCVYTGLKIYELYKKLFK